MAHATIRMVEGVHGKDAAITTLTVLITQCMEYFSPQRRMAGGQVALLAETIADEYPHESIADINVFIRGIAQGKYGDGETFGAMDIPRFRQWFAEYLDEKALYRERDADLMEQQVEQTIKDVLALPGIPAMIKTIGAEGKEEKAQASLINRLLRLQNTVPDMSDDQLREAYRFYTTAEERKLILQEADKRGLIKAAMDRITNPPSAA